MRNLLFILLFSSLIIQNSSHDKSIQGNLNDQKIPINQMDILNSDSDTLILAHFENSLLDSTSGKTSTSSGISYSSTDPLAGTYSVLIDKSSDYASWTYDTAYSQGTIDCYVTLSSQSLSGALIILSGGDGAYPSLQIKSIEGILDVDQYTASGWIQTYSKFSLQTGTDYHFTYSWGTLGKFLYVNNTLVANSSNTQALTSRLVKFGIGKTYSQGSETSALGLFDELRITNRQIIPTNTSSNTSSETLSGSSTNPSDSSDSSEINQTEIIIIVALACIAVFSIIIKKTTFSKPHSGQKEIRIGIQKPNSIISRYSEDRLSENHIDSTLFKPKRSMTVKIQPGEIIQVNKLTLKVIRQIAEGGMGIIYLSQDCQTMKYVIIKQLLTHRYQQRDYDYSSCEEYWLREQEIIQKQSKSPFISMHLLGSIKREEYGEPVYYILLEYISGPSLDKWISQKSLFMGIQDIYQILIQIVIPLCKHLEFVHGKGIIHRDITPKNIIISSFNQELTPVLIDWGVAKETLFNHSIFPNKSYFDNPSHYTTAIRSIGNPPEVIMGLPPIIASDIYMLGHIIFYLLTNGKTNNIPRTSEEYVLHVKSYVSDVPEKLNTLIEQMTQYEPAHRIQNCSVVIEQLEQIIQELKYSF